MQKSAQINQSVQKTLKIIEVMASSKEPLHLREISDKGNMSASTTLRMVNTLVTHGYAYQMPDTLLYGLTLKFAQVGSRIIAHLNIRDLVHPFLKKIADAFGESVCLCIEENFEIIYIDVVNSQAGGLHILNHIGKHVPMLSSSIGKTMLVQYTSEQLSLLLEEKRLAHIMSPAARIYEGLLKDISFVREKGYALDNEESELGVRCLASPIYGLEGRVVAAISVSGPVSRMTCWRTDEIAVSLMATTQEISRILACPEK